VAGAVSAVDTGVFTAKIKQFPRSRSRWSRSVRFFDFHVVLKLYDGGVGEKINPCDA